MTESRDEDDDATSWVVRVSRFASAEIQAGWEHFAYFAGETVANEWDAGLRAELARLAFNPTRFPVAEDESVAFGGPTRRMTYRRTRSAAAYNIFFRLDRNALDAPTVLVIHIRHSARAPITQDEAQSITGQE